MQCDAGKFMNESGKQQCHPCSRGEYCTEGASAGLPCPSGRYQDLDLAVMTSVGDCKVCPSGSFCSTGAAEPTACSPGTVQPLVEQGKCAKCDAGKFMNESGQMGTAARRRRPPCSTRRGCTGSTVACHSRS